MGMKEDEEDGGGDGDGEEVPSDWAWTGGGGGREGDARWSSPVTMVEAGSELDGVDEEGEGEWRRAEEREDPGPLMSNMYGPSTMNRSIKSLCRRKRFKSTSSTLNPKAGVLHPAHCPSSSQ